MSTVNKTLMKATLAHIKKYPDGWDQTNWCGTAQCFAGWAVTLAGMPIDERRQVVHVADMPHHLAVQRPGYDELTVREAAIVALGIEDCELPDMDDEYPEVEPELISAASVLFYSGNTLEALEHYVAELCGEPVEAVS